MSEKIKAPRPSKDNIQNPDIIAHLFRSWGFLKAEVDPFKQIPPFPHRDLDSVSEADAKKWKEVYCQNIGAEFMHMPYPERCDWITEKLEEVAPKQKKPLEQYSLDKLYILKRLIQAEVFERFLHKAYVGAKRFSLEGCCLTIPILDAVLNQAAEQGVETVILGMAHRGRLATLLLVANSSAANIMACFEDIDPKSVLGGGDVKYHRGATGVYETASGKKINIHLASNPSHLEAVNPVVMGRVKARQTRIGDKDGKKVMAILLHGDAAFAGQGISAECLNYAHLEGFSIGGTVHIIINNLIGFTAVPNALFSSRFSADIAKRIPVPIFHVHGEKPDEATRVAQMATDYRFNFSSDVVIDLIGYRRWGHNEVDDPTTTSPVLYDKIKTHPPLFEIYAKEAGIPESKVKELEDGFIKHLREEQAVGRSLTKQPTFFQFPEYWQPFFGGLYSPDCEVETCLPEQEIAKLSENICSYPKDFNIHPKIQKSLEARHEMYLGKKHLDFGAAESLAFASILASGLNVRVIGQDSRRGTFNHRQAVHYDIKTNQPYVPLASLKGNFEVYDSMLSEAAAVGFEYGFSRDYPESLVCWEAQFGDFVNGAQIIIDQFISAGEDKWQLLSGLVMLLPHGFEGMGPEHSSARPERFLQLCAEDNMQVVYPSTSGQHFHMFRRQALRKWRKPLIVLTPKGMLRLPAACSDISEIINGSFQTAINDDAAYKNASRVLVCTGKIVHELRAERNRLQDKDTAIITIEQLYPFPENEVKSFLNGYTSAKTITWVQEEPANMGALFFVKPLLDRIAGGRTVTTVKRSASASPATGSPKAHAMEQQAIINMAFAKFK